MPLDDFETIYTNPGTRKLLEDLKRKEQAKAIMDVVIKKMEERLNRSAKTTGSAS